MLKIHAIKKRFKKNEVLKDINLTVKKGELIYIKGGNGCGKSTLLKIIANLLRPDEGSLEISPDVKIGALIENPNFIETESLKYNLKFLYSLTNPYKSDDEAKIQKLTERFFLDFDLTSSMKKYSLGMRQKAGIIQAIMENQNLLLFDEPTRGLDQESISVFNELLNELLDEGKSMIICAHEGMEHINVTHSYELKDGKLIQLS